MRISCANSSILLHLEFEQFKHLVLKSTCHHQEIEWLGVDFRATIERISSSHKPWIRLSPGCGSAIFGQHVGFMWRWGRNLKDGNGCQLRWIRCLHSLARLGTSAWDIRLVGYLWARRARACVGCLRMHNAQSSVSWSSLPRSLRGGSSCSICRCRFWCAMHTNSSSVAFTHSEALILPIPRLGHAR